VTEDAVEWSRDASEVESLDEQARVLDLSASAASHEAAKLLLCRAPFPLRLLLERTERGDVALSRENVFNRCGAEGANQLGLEIGLAYVEAEFFHFGAGDIGAQAGALESTSEFGLLSGVAEAGDSDVTPFQIQAMEEPADPVRAPDRNDRNTFGLQVPATACGERFDRDLVADSLDDHGHTHLNSPNEAHRDSALVCPRNVAKTDTDTAQESAG
jgi:hypothetical protein